MSGLRPSWQGLPAMEGANARRTRKLPLVLAGILVAICLVMFLVILRSMWMTLREEAGSTRYDIVTGQPISASDLTLMKDETTYLAITAVTLDEASSTVTLRISGHRVCADCLPMTLQLFALDRNPNDWWGLPPSDSLDLPAETAPFTENLTLPLSGAPSRYPMDDYHLQLGISLERTDGGGDVTYITPAGLKEDQILIAVNEQLPRFRMGAPVAVPIPSDAQSRGIVAALDLDFRRPLFLPMVAALLVSLILISSVLSTVLQATGEVFLGIGSIILGVWGISSIVVQTTHKGLTFIDLSLATVIMIVLLGITIRGALIIARR